MTASNRTAPHVIRLASTGLTRDDVVAVARDGARVDLTDDAIAAVDRARAILDGIAASEKPTYGVSTGFGALASVRVDVDRRVDLQHSIVRSHAAGMGQPVETEVVRAMMLLRARTLAMGFSGVCTSTVQAIVNLLNADLTPIVPEHGSLGASGDLAPLAHVALSLLGEGVVATPDGSVVPTAEALERAGLAPISLREKEGLSLVNGTDGMLGMLILACEDAARLFATADVSAAMSVEALLGTDGPFATELQALRPHPGQADSAANLRTLLAGSGILASHRDDPHRVQDAYSLRCSPQVAGAARDTLAFALRTAEIELASAVDNPSVLPDGRVESNGNFHGAPLAFACDFLAIAASEVGAISERRLDRLLDATRSDGLPAFLAGEPGVDSGLMIAQYTVAAMCAENRRLASPASVDSIPTSGMQEDHVSMGWGAARKLRRVLDNLGRILAVELLAAAAALDIRAPLEPAPATGAVRNLLRTVVAAPGRDHHLAPDLAAVEALVRSGAVIEHAEAVAGPLH